MSIVHSGRLLKRRMRHGVTLACVPRAAPHLKRKRKAPKPPKPRKRAPKRKAPTRKAPKRKAPKRKAPKRKAPKRDLRKQRVGSKRSEAAKKGWEKRRKKQRLIKAMHDAKWRHTENSQPIGWFERRAELREIRGELWREIVLDFSDSEYQARHLAALEELEIDLLTKDELADYLEWMAAEYDMDISDLYRLYLGYGNKGEL